MTTMKKKPTPQKLSPQSDYLKKIGELMQLQSRMPAGEFQPKEEAYRSMGTAPTVATWAYCNSVAK